MAVWLSLVVWVRIGTGLAEALGSATITLPTYQHAASSVAAAVVAPAYTVYGALYWGLGWVGDGMFCSRMDSCLGIDSSVWVS